MTDKLKNFNKDDIKVSFYSTNKLRKYIKVHKDLRHYFSKNNVVYKIDCVECDATYVGQTDTKLKTRVNEHKNHIRNMSTRLVIT